MVAHNCSFDRRHFVNALEKLSLLVEYAELLFGFADSLALFKKKFPKRATGHKLTTLAEELFLISCENAHDVAFDVEVLEKLCT